MFGIRPKDQFEFCRAVGVVLPGGGKPVQQEEKPPTPEGEDWRDKGGNPG